MVEPRLRPLGVPLHTRRIRDVQLLGHEVQHHHRHIQRILQEHPHIPHRHQLKTEAQPHVITTTVLDQRPILVIEEEHPLQLRPRRPPDVPAISRRLVISQKLHRHTPQSRTDQPVTNPRPPNRYKISTTTTPPASERWTAVIPAHPAR